jgi:adenosylcobinamide-GDP ribazoletransferase
MKKQLDIFLTALMFFTRIPVPKNIGHGSDMLQKSARYFSWVGLIVGGISCLAFYLLQFVFPVQLAILFSMIAGILTTGAFHEDGFADVCDAFGGGWTKEKILLIMKDSRLGTYGVIGLISILALKYTLLLELLHQQSLPGFLFIMLAAHTGSRFTAVTIMQQYVYVTDSDVSKSKPLANRKLTVAELTIAAIAVILPMLLLSPFYWLAFVPVIIARLYLGNYFFKWIGGYTGDCLGAMQQVAEIFFYLGCLLIWKFI